MLLVRDITTLSSAICRAARGATLQRVLASMDLVLCPVGLGAPDLLVASNFAWIAPADVATGGFRRQQSVAGTAATRGVDTRAGGDGTAPCAQSWYSLALRTSTP